MMIFLFDRTRADAALASGRSKQAKHSLAGFGHHHFRQTAADFAALAP
jgi:hypothetical protein